jgi:hypothetical protein
MNTNKYYPCGGWAGFTDGHEAKVEKRPVEVYDPSVPGAAEVAAETDPVEKIIERAARTEPLTGYSTEDLASAAGEVSDALEGLAGQDGDTDDLFPVLDHIEVAMERQLHGQEQQAQDREVIMPPPADIPFEEAPEDTNTAEPSLMEVAASDPGPYDDGVADTVNASPASFDLIRRLAMPTDANN